MFYYKGKPYIVYFGNTEKRRDLQEGNLTEDPLQIDQEYICVNHSLYVRVLTARGVSADEMPAWMQGATMAVFEPEMTELIRFDPESRSATLIDPNFDLDRIPYQSCDECLLFAMSCLFHQNKYLYEMLTNAKNASQMGCVETNDLTKGLLHLILDPKKQTQIESLAKTVGVKFAISQISNNIDCTGGKKALILKFDQLHRIKTMRLDDAVPTLQALVQNNVMSLDQMDRFLEGLRYLFKFKLDEQSRMANFFSYYGDKLVEKQVNLEYLLTMALKSAFTLDLLKGNYEGRRDHHRSSPTPISSLMRHYMDAVAVLPVGKYPTNNIEIFHVITTRNNKIFEARRPEEFAMAAEKLRKLIWDNGEYLFRPIQTEEELFFIGERYNNCLPVYRDKICDEGAVVVAVYKQNADGTLAECPDVVFETSSRLDIIQIKTYNDEDVTDPFFIEMIANWKKSKSYLLSGNRTVYRDPEPVKDKKPKDLDESGISNEVSDCNDTDVDESAAADSTTTEDADGMVETKAVINVDTEIVLPPIRSIEKENGQFAMDIA